ncbi:GtrA family protein [Streptomyces adelaidensis]|uniref:GtrA family protein n=1 Tax=Streptomyces adelaidensis TaxID=2796465 RepID=UPI0027DE107D|nr:GtrA family protein [Streptomyces adelaidensis]
MSILAILSLRVRETVRGVWREAARFTVVGALAFVMDNGGYNLLVFGFPGGDAGPMSAAPIQASVVATGSATGFSWLGNRYWVYRHRRRAEVAQELALFLFINIVGIVITAGTVFLSRHLIGLDSALSDNAARIFGWVVATLFRFLTYRRYVFVTP